MLIPRLEAAGYIAYRIGREDRSATKGVTTHVFDEFSGNFVPSLGAADAVISLAPLPSIDVVVKMAQALGAKRIIAFGSMGRFSKLGSASAIEQDFVVQQERAENIFSMQCETAGMGWTLFRPTMIYGADSDLNVSFIKSMISKFGFFPIPVGANGLRQPVHVDDLASACVLALVHGVTCNKAYNLGGGEVLRFPVLVERIFEAEGKRAILIPMPMLLFSLLISIAKKFPKAAFVRKEMVERMFQDLTADSQAAKDDFGYAPRPFCLKMKVPNRGGLVRGHRHF
ncbi:SDR family oxidoreductase [Laribacter hongkongensis]|uniref:SDR family oxidoreductase n=1 Tax=Laribacter hongkongensis TaxID=168471 RepID=UPI00068F81D0|nr:NAD-dependent epimerase/dehydratase family protein [Laribacter hongkongensis]